MALAANDLLFFSIRSTCFGQRIIFTHTYYVSEAFPAGGTVFDDCNNMLTALKGIGAGSVLLTYRQCIPDAVQINELRLQRVRPVRMAYVSDFPLNMTGQNELAATVANDSAAVTLRTSFAGRDQVSVKKVGPCPDGVSANGLLTAGYKATLSAFAAALLVERTPAVGAGRIKPCVLNPVTNTVTDLTSFRIGEQSRTMSRRTVGRGE